MNALKEAGVPAVRLSTTQNVSDFFERAGFYITETVADDYGPGLDRVEMVCQLNPDS